MSYAVSRQFQNATIPMKLPPHNLEAEMAVLGGMVLDNATIDDVAGVLKAEDFYRDVHQALYRAILEVRGNGRPVDALLLWEHLQRGDHARDFADGSILAEVRESTPDAVNTTYYAAIVRQKAVSRELIEASNATIRECYSNQFLADELVEAAESRVFAIGRSCDSGETSDLAAAIADAQAMMERRCQGEVTGVASGFEDLDDVVGGFEPGSLTIVAARPSAGKTAFALNICEHSIFQAGVTPYLVSLEMSRAELGHRMVQARSGVDGYKIRNAFRLTDAERARVFLAQHDLAARSFPLDESSSRTIGQIAATARRLKARQGVGLLVVDYLQLIQPDNERDSRQEQVSKISRRLKAVARELHIPVIALSQLNRGVEHREDKRPLMSDLRDSGAIEQDADVILLLHRPEYYDPNDQPGIAEVNVAKNRNGATSTIRLSFAKHAARFNTLARAYHYDHDPAFDA